MKPQRGEEGAGVVLVIGVVVLLAVLSTVCAGAVAVIAVHRQVQAAADLAALAGAGALWSGREPCSEAARIAVANGAELTGCSASSGVVEVVVEAEVRFAGSRTLAGRARAGPAPEEGPTLRTGPRTPRSG